MTYGPFLFVGLLCALALSWLGMIAAPQLQVGNQQPTNVPPTNVLYPTPAPGLAQLGREVYRANGCAYCHTRVVRQKGTLFDVVLTSAGTNEAAVVQALRQMGDSFTREQAAKIVASLPQKVLSYPAKSRADEAQEALTDAGAEAGVRVVPTGPDIARGWGTRLTVGQDYLYGSPLMLGTTRIGPDLANIGLRRPDPVWHLVHLWDPKLKVQGSTMPQYPFLFDVRPREGAGSPGALPIPGDREVIPTRDAHALVAYLLSLRIDLPLFEAPAPQPPGSKQPTPSDTNSPAATGEANAPAAAANESAPAAAPAQGNAAPAETQPSLE